MNICDQINQLWVLNQSGALNEDEFAREVLGKSMLHQFFSYKMDEWDRYHQSVTDWEVQEFLRLY